MSDNNSPKISNRNKQIENAIEAAAMSFQLAWYRYSEDNMFDSNRNMDPPVAVTSFLSTLNQFLEPLELDQSAHFAAISDAQSRLTTLRCAKTSRLV
jgi:hypothetical protein